ncbi:MAG: D-aminoacyl-tRNA deacylase, partial [Armatimonadota bacterium]
RMRIVEDSAGKMNESVLENGGYVLAVSQFTLLADTSRGRRPGFEAAAKPEEAEGVYTHFVAQLKAQGCLVQCGVFGAHMQVRLTNDGPVTIMLHSPHSQRRVTHE